MFHHFYSMLFLLIVCGIRLIRQTKAVIVGIAFAVYIRREIQLSVLRMLLHRLHIPRHLDRQASPRRIVAKQYFQHCPFAHTKLHCDAICLRFKFAHHHRI